MRETIAYSLLALVAALLVASLLAWRTRRQREQALRASRRRMQRR